MSVYKKSDKQDALVLIHPKEWRRIMLAEGQYSERELSELFDYLEGKTTKKPLKYKKGVVGPMKTFLFNQRVENYSEVGIKLTVPMMEKCTLVPLFTRFIEDDKGMQDVREAMEKTGAQHAAFNTALKYGMGESVSPADLKSMSKEQLNKYVYVVGRDNFGTQTVNPPHFQDQRNDSMRQFKMLMPAGLTADMKFGDKTGIDIRKELFDLESSILEAQIDKLDIELKDKKRLAARVKRALTERNYSERMEKLLATDSQGNFIHDISLFSKQFEEMISAIVKDSGLKVDFPGGILIASTSIHPDKELEIKRNEDGSVRYYECKISSYYKGFFNEDGTLKGSVQQEMENGELPQLTQLIGFRIPTEGYHSVMPLKVKQFIDDTYNGQIFLPHEAVGQTGQDFDNDKIYFIFPEFTEKDGVISIVPNDGSIEGKRNRMFELWTEILRHPDIAPHIASPSNLQSIEENHKRIIDEKNKYADAKAKRSFFDPLFQATQKAINHTGVKLKGIAALRVTTHAAMSYVNMKLSVVNGRQYAIRFNDVNEINLGGQYSVKNNGRSITKELSSILAGILDDLKNPKVRDLGINDYTLGVVSTILDAGFSMDVAVDFITQPVIKNLVKIMSDSSKEVKSSKTLYTKAEEYTRVQLDVLGNEIKQLSHLSNIEQYKEITKEIESTVSGNSSDRYHTFMLSQAELVSNRINGEYKRDEFKYTPVELQNIANGQISKELKDKIEKRLAYLIIAVKVAHNFSQYNKISADIQQFGKVLATNKEVGPRFENSIEKVEVLRNLLNNTVRTSENAEKIAAAKRALGFIEEVHAKKPNLTITGIENIVDDYTPALTVIKAAQLNNNTLGEFLLYDTGFFRSIKNDLISGLETNSNRFDADKLNTIDKEVEGYLNWEFLQAYFKLESPQDIKDLFVGPKSLALQIREFLSKYPEEYDNPLFRKAVMEFQLATNEGDVNLIKMQSSQYETAITDLMSNAWNAYNNINDDVTEQRLIDMKAISQRLILYAVAASNMWYAQNSFHKIMPADFFEDSGWNDFKKMKGNVLRTSSYVNEEGVRAEMQNIMQQVYRNNLNLLPQCYKLQNGAKVLTESKYKFPLSIEFNINTMGQTQPELTSKTDEPVSAFTMKVKQQGAKEQVPAIYILDTNKLVQGEVVYNFATPLGKNGYIKEYWFSEENEVVDSLYDINNHDKVFHKPATKTTAVQSAKTDETAIGDMAKFTGDTEGFSEAELANTDEEIDMALLAEEGMPSGIGLFPATAFLEEQTVSNEVKTSPLGIVLSKEQVENIEMPSNFTDEDTNPDIAKKCNS